MDASWKNSLEEELLCPICLNVFVEPIQLPCKHNFCKDCISEAWAKDNAAVRCPECNHNYSQKPALEKNFKLANIVKRFNALNTEKAPVVLQCVLCRRGPPLPVRKVCLRCKEPCCQVHIQTHLQQPCAAPGHLLVDAEELSAWTCPTHEEYRLLHCEEEHVALCPFCCISHCTNQRHTVCDVDMQRIQMQATLMRQQDRLEGRVQTIDEQLAKLEADKTLMKDTVSDLKERVRAQYQRMHRLLEENQSDTMQMLESTCSVYGRKQSQQVLQLNERRQEAEKLLSSVQTFLQKADNINFMKNTKPYQMLMDRSTSHLISAMPPLGLGQLNSDHLLSELSTREKNLRKMLEEPLNESAIVEIVQSRAGSAGSQLGTSSAPQKRKYSMAFMGSKTENSTSQNPHPSSSHIRLLDSPAHHIMGVGSSSSHHSGTIFPSSHFPSGGASQQAMYEGRKVLMCTLNNCCCSRAPAPRARPPYPPSGSFAPMTSQEFPPHGSQPLQHFPMGGLMVGSQAARHPDFYELYGQPSAKHYGTK
ncbi:E3 ubiquitin-protein ligase TRIM8a [Pleuronectes platessa]|uniref:E3 ubiquitin-protein ligase TRIM8a n=1 Tax=Pleuronectes platessa TaxID=8262 RepID=UPI00232A2D15|nr:E3 ubiquitin-protein ligase TRIM8a [Pleuronectes platessa]